MNSLVVCEGIPDALTAASLGLRSVGTLGAQMPDAAIAKSIACYCDRTSSRVTLVNDADRAGRAWASAISDLLASHFVQPTLIEPPLGLDLNEWVVSVQRVDAMDLLR